MSLSPEDVRAIADYARIALTEEELQNMCSYMNSAIELLEPIRQMDLDGVEPTFHPIGDLSNVMAPDCASLSQRALDIDEALSNTAARKERYFQVPSILNDEGGDR